MWQETEDGCQSTADSPTTQKEMNPADDHENEFGSGFFPMESSDETLILALWKTEAEGVAQPYSDSRLTETVK